MRDSGFARAFKRLIVVRIEELVSNAQQIAESGDSREYKLMKLDKQLDMIEHNFRVYSSFFKTPYGQKEKILENLNLLYKLQ
jgi:hypothetical protein